MLDSGYQIETPEGIELELAVAGPVVRGLALLIDLLIQTVLWIVLLIILMFVIGDSKFGLGISLIVAFILFWFYPVIFEVFYNGATPGKKVMKLRVVHDDGTPIAITSSIIRNFMLVIEGYTGSYFFGFMAMIMNRNFKRLGDLAAGTLVVHQAQTKPAGELSEQKSRAPAVSLTLEEQGAIMGFAERQSMLSNERAVELASIVKPPLVSSDEASLKQLNAFANWFRGH